MMRFSLVQRARRDMVDLLLQRGRLADMQMLTFFTNRVETEIASMSKQVEGAAAAAAAATSGVSKPTAAESSTTAGKDASATPKGALEDKTTAFLSLEDRLREVAQTEKQAVFTELDTLRAKVRAAAMTAGPMSWMADVYGRSEWSTSHLSYRTVKATLVDGTPSPSVVLSGRTTAAGGGLAPGKLPDSVQVIVRVKPSGPKSAADDADGTGETKRTKPLLNAVPEFVAVSVKLNQGADKVTAKLVNGLLEVQFHDAQGEVKVTNTTTKNAKGEQLEIVYKDPAQIAARQHLLTAAAYAGLLAKMEEVVALHITTASQYDGLLVRNGAVQMRLSQLACFRYGIESLMSFVAGDADLDPEDLAYVKKKVLLDSFLNAKQSEGAQEAASATGGGAASPGTAAAAPTQPETVEGEEVRLNYLAIVKNERERLHQLPLLESVVLNIYAENALMDGMDCAWHIVKDYPLHAKVPHRSRPEKLIDYPYLSQILDTPKYSIASADGSMELQALEYLSPLLGRDAAASASGEKGFMGSVNGLVERLQAQIGLTTAGHMRLTAAHVNLRVAAATVEEDLRALLSFVEKERLSTVGKSGTADPAFVFCVSNYLAEVFTNVGVLYRSTAALTAEEEGMGHREWLLAQCFTAASNARRRRYLTDFHLMKAAVKAVGSEEAYATHPIELMNVAPRKKGSGTEAGDEKTAAAAGKKQSPKA